MVVGSPGSTAPGGPASAPGGSPVFTITNREQVPACAGNDRELVQNLCEYATTCPDPLDTRYWVYVQRVQVDTRTDPDTTTVLQDWQRQPGDVCLGPEEVAEPGIGEVVNAVQTGFTRKRPAEPQLVIQPNPTALVNVDTGFSAGAAEPVQLTDTVLGFPIAITATPERWLWDFGDGTTLATSSPGRAGTREVSHRYTRVGDYAVTVAVEWSGTFTVGGFAQVFPIEGVAVVPVAAPGQVQVREARTQLVDQ